MRIIKHGVLPEDMLAKHTCRNCSAVLEFSKRDGKITYDQRDGNFFVFTCPCCMKNDSVDMVNLDFKVP